MYHEYNAVYLQTDGMFKRTRVAFGHHGAFSEALDGFKKIVFISRGALDALGNRVGQPLAIVYVQDAATYEGHEKNELANLVAGSTEIYGKAIICGLSHNKPGELDPETIKELCNILQWEYRSKLHGVGRSKPKPQPKPQPKPSRSVGSGDPNAIYLHTDGMFKRTHVEFGRSRGMREALDDCTSLSVVTAGALSKLGRRVGESLAIVYDHDAENNGEDENELASLVAGATTVYGKAFLCGIDGDEPQELDPDTIKELCNILQWEYRSQLQGGSRSKPQPKPQPKPTRSAEGSNNNAVRLFADGAFKRTYVDFNDEDGPEHALNCSSVRKIRSGPLAKLSQRVGQTLTVFHTRDSAGQRQNDLAARITGYDLVPGDAILCAYGDGYEPLKPDAIKALCDIIQLEYRSQGEQPAPKPSPKPASGKGDFGDYSAYRSSRDSRQSHPEPARKPQPAKETYYLELIIANFGMKKDVIAALQEIDGNISSWDAIQMMKNTPVVIRRGMTKAEADAGFDALSELGCNVKIQRE